MENLLKSNGNDGICIARNVENRYTKLRFLRDVQKYYDCKFKHFLKITWNHGSPCIILFTPLRKTSNFFTEFRKRYVLKLSVFWKSLKSWNLLPWGKHAFSEVAPSKTVLFQKCIFRRSGTIENKHFLKNAFSSFRTIGESNFSGSAHFRILAAVLSDFDLSPLRRS